MSLIFGALPSMSFGGNFPMTTCYQLKKKEMISKKKRRGEKVPPRKEYIIERESSARGPKGRENENSRFCNYSFAFSSFGLKLFFFFYIYDKERERVLFQKINLWRGKKD